MADGGLGRAHPDGVLEEAVHALARRRPEASAQRVLTTTQAIGLLVCVVAGVWAVWAAAAATAAAAHIAVWVIFAAASITRLAAAWAALAPPPSPRARWTAPLPTYTLLCPLFREARMVGPLVAALDRLDYPAHLLDIKLVLEESDAPTIAAARHWARGRPITLVIVPPGGPQTKPRALNYALSAARGTFVTVYDAEDTPNPAQLRAALDAFAADPRLAVVQAPLYVRNARESWIASQFATEYAIQFAAVLPLFARAGLPFPLGGTSNHFRAAALRLSGAWDPFNVTEDADIGYRLAMDGWRMGVIAPPTWEEAPTTLTAWVRQRSRWIKGHLQSWLVLMRNPARAVRDLGVGGFLAMQLLLGGGIAAAFVHAPMAALLVAAAVLPGFAVPALDWSLAAFGYLAVMTAALFTALISRDATFARAAATMPLYWPLTTIAALRALIELALRPHYWAKTNHGWRTRRGKTGAA
jgi:cellulose synthase/poly-beta-1,6-N-acetylglucosamine synthase-like glycosyltransferase